MGARIDFTVTLAPEESAGSLRVSFDHDAPADDAVDFIAGGPGRLLSCSLDEAEQFAMLLSTFVAHHRERGPSAAFDVEDDREDAD